MHAELPGVGAGVEGVEVFLGEVLDPQLAEEVLLLPLLEAAQLLSTLLQLLFQTFDLFFEVGDIDFFAHAALSGRYPVALQLDFFAQLAGRRRTHLGLRVQSLLRALPQTAKRKLSLDLVDVVGFRQSNPAAPRELRAGNFAFCATAKRRVRAAATSRLGHTQIGSQVFLLVPQKLSLQIGCEGEEVGGFWESQTGLSRKELESGV